MIIFTDASWQDCPDTSRSTESYLIYLNGGLIDGASFVPSPVALSSAESEYNAAAHGVTGALHMRQLYQTLRGLDPDTPLTMPMFVDSQSAIAMSRNSRDTR